MSGLLRRIKRSRTAGAGEPPADEQAAAPGGASTTAETAPAGDESKTTELPVTTPPALAADPDRPAGLDEHVVAAQPPSGRRGRLRRRLRYLRRARELMLRDLGGLVYEVHRSGGGDFSAHRAVVDGKIERLVLLDAESGAIEQALGSPRGESVVFEPGVGGTCDECGELYPSSARFCSRCGTPTDPAARATPAPSAEPRHVPPMPKAPGTAAAAAPAAEARGAEGDEAKTAVLQPTGEAPTGADELAAEAPAAVEQPAAEPAATEEPAADAAATEEPVAEPAATEQPAAEQPTAEEPATEQPPGAAAGEEPQDPGRNPFRNISNGRPEEKSEPPELSSGDPLATRETRK